MQIAVIGISHKEAPVDIRSKAAFTDSLKIKATKLLIDEGIEEFIILSTCNRSEIYIASEDLQLCIGKVKNFYINFFDTPELNDYLFIEKNQDAIERIFDVSCGLDSIIIGEDQILGQVKDAMETSIEQGSCSKFLCKIFREAITFSKKVRTEYKFSENPLSVSSIGVKFLKHKLGDIKDKNVLIIGTGKMGVLTLKYLIEYNVNSIYVANRSSKKVQDLVKEYPLIKAIDYKDRYKVIKDVDIIISGTSSPHTVINKKEFPKVDRLVTILDLAVPRDIEPKVNELPNVQVFTVDDLETIANESKVYRLEIASKIKDLIGLNVSEIQTWIMKTKVDPIIKSFNELSTNVTKDTLKSIYKKIDLEDKEKAYLEKLLEASLKRMIKHPIKQLKELDQENEIIAYKQMIQYLFKFEEGA